MTLTSYNVLQRALECSVCSKVFLVGPPDGSHTSPYLRRPASGEDVIRVRQGCLHGHGTYVYWTNPPIARTVRKSSIYTWPYIMEW